MLGATSPAAFGFGHDCSASAAVDLILLRLYPEIVHAGSISRATAHLRLPKAKLSRKLRQRALCRPLRTALQLHRGDEPIVRNLIPTSTMLRPALCATGGLRR